MTEKVYINVVTFNLATGKETDAKVIEYSRSRARAWLADHMFWAFNNGHGVQLCNVKDDEAAKRLERTEVLTVNIDASEIITTINREMFGVVGRSTAEALADKDQRRSFNRSRI